MKQCPYCHEEIQDDAVTCPVCGEDVGKDIQIHIETKKICPFCNEEVGKNDTVCPVCGEKLPDNFKINSDILKKIALAVVSLILVIGLLFGAKFAYDSVISAMGSTEVITSAASMEDKSTVEVIERVLLEENALAKYLENKHSQLNKDKLFLAFLKNIEKYAQSYGSIYQYTGGSNMYSGEENFEQDGVKYISRIQGYWPKSIKIVSPECNAYSFNYDMGGYFGAVINYDYFLNKYGDYLSDSVKDFLKMQLSVYRDLDGQIYWNVVNDYYEGEYLPFRFKKFYLRKWAKKAEEFLAKYPDFPSKGTVKNYLDSYKQAKEIDLDAPVLSEDNLTIEREGLFN